MEAEANETTGMNQEEVNAFSGLTDEELITEIKEHTNSDALDYLINKYRNFVRAKARSYFLIGADREDIIQEGMIGFYKAVRDFRNDKLSSFRAFAELCVTRQIITAIKTATRQKHIPLNSYVSLNKPIYSYSLGVLAFWTQMLFYTMIGTHHFIFSPLPWWLQTVAIVFSIPHIIFVGLEEGDEADCIDNFPSPTARRTA